MSTGDAPTALVVYESMFGNTAEVGRAVADGLEDTMTVTVRSVQDTTDDAVADVDLVVAGGPTHAFSMSRSSTRSQAHTQGAPGGRDDVGLREWLEARHAGPHSPWLATFDTKVAKVRRLPGSAAKGAARLGHKRGFDAMASPESFYVADTPGPLVEGEVERARAWGRELAGLVEARAGVDGH